MFFFGLVIELIALLNRIKFFLVLLGFIRMLFGIKLVNFYFFSALLLFVLRILLFTILTFLLDVDNKTDSI
jgi:hypothetical protein